MDPFSSGCCHPKENYQTGDQPFQGQYFEYSMYFIYGDLHILSGRTIGPCLPVQENGEEQLLK